MQLAAKQLLKLGVNPTVITRLTAQAEAAGLTLREHVQTILGNYNPEGCTEPDQDVLPADYWETAQ